jgi:hypothetical protein
MENESYSILDDLMPDDFPEGANLAKPLAQEASSPRGYMIAEADTRDVYFLLDYVAALMKTA